MVTATIWNGDSLSMTIVDSDFGFHGAERIIQRLQDASMDTQDPISVSVSCAGDVPCSARAYSWRTRHEGEFFAEIRIFKDGRHLGSLRDDSFLGTDTIDSAQLRNMAYVWTFLGKRLFDKVASTAEDHENSYTYRTYIERF